MQSLKGAKQKVCVQVGDLVRVNQSIKEYTAILGKTVGTVVNVTKSDQRELFEWQLVDVYWPGGPVESLYSNEIEVI